MEEIKNVLKESIGVEIEPVETETLEEVQKQGELIPYKTSLSTKNIDTALVEFNKEVGSIEKGEVNPFYKNYYASLDQIISYVRPILAKHDLFIQQFPIYGGEGMLSVKTILKHSSGEYIMSDSMPIKFGKTAQDFGGTQTYVRRYQLGAVLGLSFEKDDDANANKVATEGTPTQQAQPAAPRRERRSR